LDVTGIELIGEESFTIFPNPTDGLLNLSSKHQIEQVRIFDLHGRMVKQELSNQRQMNVSDLDVGLYFIQATINKQLVSTRFVKQ
jgi:ligand-binding sensor domain-containing protein